MESIIAACISGVVTLIGVIGVPIADVDLIVGWCVLDPAVHGLVVELAMAMLPFENNALTCDLYKACPNGPKRGLFYAIADWERPSDVLRDISKLG